VTLANDFGTGQVFYSFLWFFLFFIWIWLLIIVFSDIFRSHDLGGWAKALWVIGIIIFPYLGVFIYLIARGGKMHEHAVQDAQASDAAARAYIQNAVGPGGGGSAADQLSRLADLKAKGVIDDDEFQKLKAQAISGTPA
jgi:Short C-terminal domain